MALISRKKADRHVLATWMYADENNNTVEARMNGGWIVWWKSELKVSSNYLIIINRFTIVLREKRRHNFVFILRMFGARIVSVQISEAVFIQQVGNDRKWVNMCAREFIAIEWRAMDEHFHVKSTGKRWDTVISETEGKVRVTCGILSKKWKEN
uniref:AlNc14C161G7777 protein n=1 Tax=Albugo laibachii Nc14 TaxID=890382 RepID=F0WMU1_9STRA|nr:AlNc14C161G7777 [Albugo laibachii Nc14]|eukprot:CCA22626.1 AlNc14C161G7777 [Albugo laibachii Nc14]